MKSFQRAFKLPPFSRGFHLITDIITRECPELSNIDIGICQIYIQHTSASLTINENADPTVREDFESHINMLVPENAVYYKHTYEGSDDMPAHIKASLIGSSIQVPVTKGELNLGMWQGVYLCEHRNNASGRNLVITVLGH